MGLQCLLGEVKSEVESALKPCCGRGGGKSVLKALPKRGRSAANNPNDVIRRLEASVRSPL